jgi:hypothetical protein
VSPIDIQNGRNYHLEKNLKRVSLKQHEERDGMMDNILANDLRAQYKASFRTLSEIAEVFPEDRWLEPHGDIYYIPCRIAYHLASFIDGLVAGGVRDKDFFNKLPYGNWMEAKAEDLPEKKEFQVYFDGVLGRADTALAALDDAGLTSQAEAEKARLGASQMGLHLYCLREIADHTGELNKMLIENGLEDVWLH